MTRGVEAEDWREGVRGLATVSRLTCASWLVGWRSQRHVLEVGGASEDGGRRYRPQRAGRPPGEPAGRALDLHTHYQRELDPRVGELFAEFLPGFDDDAESDDDEDEDGDAV